MRLEEWCWWKIPMTSSGIEPTTFRVVAQCLNKIWAESDLLNSRGVGGGADCLVTWPLPDFSETKTNSRKNYTGKFLLLIPCVFFLTCVLWSILLYFNLHILLIKMWNILEMSDHEKSISPNIEIHENWESIIVTLTFWRRSNFFFKF